MGEQGQARKPGRGPARAQTHARENGPGSPTPAEMELGKVLTALSDPMRRKVVTELAAEPPGTERTCVSFGLPVSKSTCTHHFRVLRESGLTEDLDYGNRRGVRLRRDEIEDRFPGLLELITREPRPGDVPQPGAGAIIG